MAGYWLGALVLFVLLAATAAVRVLADGPVSHASADAESHAVANELAPGMMAPDFSLQASDGRTYRLSDFRGRQAVVLAWFPKAFTAG